MPKSNLKIKLARYEIRTDYVNLTIFMSFVLLFLAQTFNVSSTIYFLIDVPIILMIWKNLNRFLHVLMWKPIIPITLTLVVIFIFMLVGSTMNNVPLGNVVYGIYKYYRGFLFFFSTLAVVDSASESRTFSFLKGIFWINVVLTVVEFFFLGINQDLLGGVFGTIVGVNQYTNLYFVIISVYCIEKMVNRDAERKELKQVLIMSACMLAIAALAEMKYFFAEFLLLLLIAYLCLPKKLKSIFSIILIIVAIIGFYNILIYMFPEFANLVNELKRGGFVRLADLQRHYSTDYDIGRAVIFKYSNQYLLPDEKNRLIGMGVGNVTSSSIVNNSFWVKNQMTHYDQFYTSYLYNEQGIVGFILYCLLYFEIFIIGLKALLKNKTRKYGTILIMLVCGYIIKKCIKDEGEERR